jgi:mannose-6-phosphate isomerase
MNFIQILQNPLRHYAWGSRTHIPALLGQDVPSAQPVAEMWMGAHPSAPSQAGDHDLLTEIKRDPEGILGASIAAKYNSQLPFLFKLLAADIPLALQVHPNRQQAHTGFVRENQAGIPLYASNRNYKDQNHKPELLCAISDFWALNGFREIPQIIELLQRVKLTSLSGELRELELHPHSAGLRNFFHTLMTLPGQRKTQIISELMQNSLTALQGLPELSWLLRIHALFPHDIGIICILMLNLIHLRPTEAMFCNAGELHSYLGGFGVELMANSDNVIRGGCTIKHVDIDEMMSILNFTHRSIPHIYPEYLQENECVYRTEAKEFMLSSILVNRKQPWISPPKRGIEIIICLEGQADISTADAPEYTTTLRSGVSAVIPAQTGGYAIQGHASLYKAAVPIITIS